MYNEVKKEIYELAKKYRDELNSRILDRVNEMRDDDNSHFLVYRVLGISNKEGINIDIYQNKGRFLYKYAGSFLEETTIICFKKAFPKCQKKFWIDNTIGNRPKRFEIDCLVNKDAYEIKRRDATTDGDHITKEHTRIQAIKNAGYNPIRIMFYYPNRAQAINIQKTLETLYHGIGGSYFYGDNAWKYIKEQTKIDLKQILEEIACEVESESIN